MDETTPSSEELVETEGGVCRAGKHARAKYWDQQRDRCRGCIEDANAQRAAILKLKGKKR